MTFPFPVANTRKVALTYRASAQDATDLTTYTTAALAAGPASPDRELVVAVGGRANSARTISSVTIGGVAATAVATANATGGGADISAIYSAVVPTGTTAVVVVTFSGAMLRFVVGLYSKLQSRVTASATSTVTPSGTSPTTTITVPSNGAVLAAAWIGSSVSATATWTGPTEDFDLQAPDTAGSALTGASQNYNATQTSMTVTATVPSVAADQAMAVAAWGP